MYSSEPYEGNHVNFSALCSSRPAHNLLWHAFKVVWLQTERDYLQGYSLTIVPLPKSKIHHYEILKLYVGENVNRSESNISGAVLVAIPGGYAYSEHKALTDLAASLDRPRRLPILFWLILRSQGA